MLAAAHLLVPTARLSCWPSRGPRASAAMGAWAWHCDCRIDGCPQGHEGEDGRRRGQSKRRAHRNRDPAAGRGLDLCLPDGVHWVAPTTAVEQRPQQRIDRAAESQPAFGTTRTLSARGRRQPPTASLALEVRRATVRTPPDGPSRAGGRAGPRPPPTRLRSSR
jgi:hypothetical protein